MKTLRNQAHRPAASPLVADEILEFHAGRLVLLLAICGGSSGVINGLTKMAKLDFFVRYPDFFAAIGMNDEQKERDKANAVEAAMVRHHYGPWDRRYYHVLAFLEARGLITVHKSGKLVRIGLTKTGKVAAKHLAETTSFSELKEHMQHVAEALAKRTGNELKTLIYKTFKEEVGQRPLGHVIGRKLA
jgi:hypothetical protein